MTQYCHRCGGELPASPDGSSFCPHCGAPQLYFSSQDQAEAAPVDTTGALPPPRPQAVDWKTAIRCALLVGGIAAVLSLVAARVEAASMLSSAWTVCASVIALALYQKRRPQGRMDGRIGARIGLVAGLVLVSCLGVAMAVAGLVARYGLHNMAGFDADLLNMIHQVQTQVEHTAVANHVPKEQIMYLYSQEFSVWILLLGFSMLTAIVVALSILGGAVGGMLRTRRNPA